MVPPQITLPLFLVCGHLQVPPVATYAALCLWNYKPIFAGEPADNLGNLACINTFTGSLDEQWFYLVSVAIESRGAPSIELMLDAIIAARSGNEEVVIDRLQRLAEILDALGTVLQRMYEHCDPHVFYHQIRPYLAGSKNMGEAGLPRGLLYDDGFGNDEYRQYGGGSNAQSSLIQFFDIVLGIEHRPTGVHNTDGEEEGQTKSRNSFMHEMREYMPGSHRQFLEHVDTVANIREFVASRRNAALSCAYDGCLAMLRALRDKHIQMVSRYIIVKSKEARSTSPPKSSHRAKTSTPQKPPLRGTGGTALIPFLKQARDETNEPTVNEWARRLLRHAPVVESESAATLSKVGENLDGHLEVVGLAGTWRADESEGGICHW